MEENKRKKRPRGTEAGRTRAGDVMAPSVLCDEVVDGRSAWGSGCFGQPKSNLGIREPHQPLVKLQCLG